MASRFSRPSCSSSSISSGKRSWPLAMPWVRLDSMNPPLRPLAAEPISRGVDQHDVARRVALLGDDRRPQPGVPAADDAQVAALVAHERRVGVRLVDVLVPVRRQLGVGDGVEVPAVEVLVAHSRGSDLVLDQARCRRRRGTRRWRRVSGISGCVRRILMSSWRAASWSSITPKDCHDASCPLDSLIAARSSAIGVRGHRAAGVRHDEDPVDAAGGARRARAPRARPG